MKLFCVRTWLFYSLASSFFFHPSLAHRISCLSESLWLSVHCVCSPSQRRVHVSLEKRIHEEQIVKRRPGHWSRIDGPAAIVSVQEVITRGAEHDVAIFNYCSQVYFYLSMAARCTQKVVAFSPFFAALNCFPIIIIIITGTSVLVKCAASK